MVVDINVIRTAASIPGMMGAELQTAADTNNRRKLEFIRPYKDRPIDE